MEAVFRLAMSLGIFGLMAFWEASKPAREPRQSRRARWTVNLGLAALNVVVLRLSIGAAAWLAAVWAAEQKLGLFNILNAPVWVAVPFSLLSLDLAIYAQHIAAHRWRWFWRLHQVHHSDLEFDTTTALRFHPFEIILSMIYKVIWVVALGAPAIAVIAFEVILNGCALFNHGNVRLPLPVERLLRWLIVTPDMHRIHHSARIKETDSNYGFSLSCWDRCFKTYCPEPQDSQTSMQIGLKAFQNPGELDLMGLLVMPFRSLQRR